MSMMVRKTIIFLILTLFVPLSGAAQGNLFTPAVFVNDRVITYYEIEQYKRLITLLRQPGDPDKLAVERLIEARLQMDAAEIIGLTATPEEIEAGMAEFAGRANLTTEQFVQAIGQNGIARETFQAFVESGLLWRKVVQTRFGPRAQVTDDEIDRAIALSSRQAGVQVLISEIVLPANTPSAKVTAERISQRLAGQNMSEGAFASEARRYSASPSKGRGGRLDWLPLSNLPAPIAAQVIGLAPGQVSQPFPVPNAIVLFYLRDLQETGTPEQNVVAIEWAEFSVASQSEVEEVAGDVDTCDDLYGVAKGLPEERLFREVRPIAEVPGDVALELAKLDNNEISEGFSRNGTPVVLMLCARTYEIPEFSTRPVQAESEEEPADTPQIPAGPNREEVRARLINQRLNAYAEGYMAELKADATIRYQ